MERQSGSTGERSEVSLSVNDAGIVAALRFAFSGRVNLVMELMQNARRAGSSLVEIRCDTELQMLEVVDQGCGITCFDDLLRVAASGWSAEVVERESCYGMGFLAALYGAQHVVVESNGRRLDASTADLLAFERVPIAEGEVREGARISLRGVENLRAEMVRACAKGFPIDVVVNGEVCARDHADGADFVDCAVGRVRLPAMIGVDWVAYLQGFEVARSPGGYGRERAVFHLDPNTFHGRMPDRAVLVDRDLAWRKIDDCLRALVREQCVALKRAGDLDALLDSMRVLEAIGALSLLNDIPVVPEGLLVPFLPGSPFGPSGSAALNRRVTRDELSSRVVLTDEAAEDDFECVLSDSKDNLGDRPPELAPLFNRNQYLAALRALVIARGALDEGHWIYSLPGLVVEPVLPESVGMEVIHEGARFSARGHCFEDQFVLCGGIRFTGPLGQVETAEGYALVPSDNGDALALGRSWEEADVLRMYSSYRDGSDHYIEEWFVQDMNTLLAEVRAAKADDPTLLVSQVLSSLRRNPKVVGRAFRVGFDSNGGVNVGIVVDDEAFSQSYGGLHAGHPVFTREAWREEVHAGDTQRGYWPWVRAKLEEQRHSPA